MSSDGRTSALTRKSLKDLAADHIRQMIFSGGLRANEKIDQDRLAAELGTSKLPVREALIALETEGFVINLPHRGTFVAPLSREDVRDHYRIIGLVAGLAARRAAERLTDEELDGLEACLRAFDEEDDPQRQAQLNLAFHRTINRSGGSRRLHSVLRLLTNTSPNRLFEFASGWIDVARQQHWRILGALRSRLPAEAECAMIDHIIAGGNFGLRTMEQSGFWVDEGVDASGVQGDRPTPST